VGVTRHGFIEEDAFMFARTLELNMKIEKKPEFTKKVREEILPILRKEPGFVDVLGLESETEPKVFVVTLWYTKLDAERYEKATFPKGKQILEPYLTVPPIVKFYAVETTISEKFIESVAV